MLAGTETFTFLTETFGLINFILTSNSKLKQCLNIDTRDVNDLEPGNFRTQADSGKEQICYYNRNKKDASFSSFLATRKETLSPSEINFSIVKVIGNKNKHDSINSDVSDELSDFKNNIVQRTIQRASEDESVGKTATKQQHIQRPEYTGHGRVIKKPRFLSR